MPEAAFVDVPQACRGRINAQSARLGTCGLTTSNFGQCVIFVVLGTNGASLTHVDNVMNLGSLAEEVAWAGESAKVSVFSNALTPEHVVNKRRVRCRLNGLGIRAEYANVPDHVARAGPAGSLQVIAGGPETEPSVSFESPKAVVRHPLATTLTSAVKALDHVKLLFVEETAPAHLVYDCTHWVNVNPSGLLPKPVDDFVASLPIDGSLRGFLAAMHEKVAVRLEKPEIRLSIPARMGMSFGEVKRIQVGPGRDHDQCLFLANLLRLRADDGIRLRDVVMNSIAQLSAAVDPSKALDAELGQDASSDIEELIRKSKHVLQKRVAGMAAGMSVAPTEVQSVLEQLERHFVTGYAQTWDGQWKQQGSVCFFQRDHLEHEHASQSMRRSFLEMTREGSAPFKRGDFEASALALQAAAVLCLKSHTFADKDTCAALFNCGASLLGRGDAVAARRWLQLAVESIQAQPASRRDLVKLGKYQDKLRQADVAAGA